MQDINPGFQPKSHRILKELPWPVAKKQPNSIEGTQRKSTGKTQDKTSSGTILHYFGESCPSLLSKMLTRRSREQTKRPT
jgi:hypothetical protein